MSKANLPKSKRVGDKVELSCPCEKHVIYYPAHLAQLAMGGQYAVFHTMCECGTAYIVVACQGDGGLFLLSGEPFSIATRYEALPWPEREGVVSFKLAPSPTVVQAYFDVLQGAPVAEE